jgi:pyruvate/2-oxoglutarate dehydrogenase complex dihydrolipoamide dehydrogenase (E3) component
MEGLIESNYLYLLNNSQNTNELICRFHKDNPDHGHQPDKSKTWSLVLKQAKENSFISLKGITDFQEKCPFVTSMYLDQYNCKLYDAIRPVEWVDPIPKGTYDVVIIGAGMGGMAAAIKAVQHNFKVALIERSYMGGEHYNVGMIAFNVLEHCAEITQKLNEAQSLGLEIPKDTWKLSMKKVMEQVRQKRAQITPEFCSVFAFTDTYGIDLYLGNAKFIGPQTIIVNSKILQYSKAIIATGSQLTIPKLEGLGTIPYYTIESILNMTKRPNSLVIYGWGQIACAYAQVFQRMRIDVTLLSEEKKLLRCTASESINKYTEHTLKYLGVKVLTGVTMIGIESNKEGKNVSYVITADVKGVKYVVNCQAILIATPKKVYI